MKKKIILKSIISILIVLFIFNIFPISVYAEGEVESSTDLNGNVGWLDVKASVPEGFKEPINVVIFSEKENKQIIYHMFPENNYKEIYTLPVGKYELMFTEVDKDTYSKYEVTDKNDIYEFNIESKTLATAIDLDVTEANVVDNLIKKGNEEITEKPEPTPTEEPTTEIPKETTTSKDSAKNEVIEKLNSKLEKPKSEVETVKTEQKTESKQEVNQETINSKTSGKNMLYKLLIFLSMLIFVIAIVLLLKHKGVLK